MSQLTLYGNPITIKSDNVFMEAPLVNAYFSAEELSGSIDIGLDAGHGTGLHNVIIGTRAGEDNVSAYDSVLIGYEAGNSLTTPNNNTLVGKSAGTLLVAATDCTFVGANTGTSRTAGNQNSNFGSGSGSAATAGSVNLCLGHNAGSVAPTVGSNCILIAHAGVASDSSVIRLGTVGTQLKNFQAGIAGVTTDVAAVACLVSSTGQLGVTSSNIAKKENFQPLPEDVVKELLHSMPIRKYQYKEGHRAINVGPNIEDLRVNAALYYPDLIVKNEDGSDLGIATQYLQWLMLHDMQRMQKEIDILKGVETVIKPDYELKY